MFLWRISLYPVLTGIGAELESGRWHTRATGKRIVYLAEHPAVALLENLANLDEDPAFFPNFFQLIRIAAPQDTLTGELSENEVAAIDPADPTSTQSLGDAWLAARTSALLRVPSIPSPESWNYLLNPAHPDASSLTVDWARSLKYDRRLFHLSPR